ncbi:hypothetical protein [Bacillus sp. mrc49]|uniref:hypothetical protein n=1 Tax=Bacillus sp. mrc49 TaxID=2054913 RepID=UPI0012FE6260|nr:hypothetical protein [Bacillus sp. mrc49]
MTEDAVPLKDALIGHDGERAIFGNNGLGRAFREGKARFLYDYGHENVRPTGI